MSTNNARIDTNTNLDVYLTAIDRDLVIDEVLEHKYITAKDGVKEHWIRCKFRTIVDNLGIVRKYRIRWCILPEPVSLDDLNDYEINGKGYTRNQQLYKRVYREWNDINTFSVLNYIFVKMECYERSQDWRKPNYDADLLVGNCTFIEDYVMNLKMPETYSLKTLKRGKIQKPLTTSKGANVNVTSTRVYCGKYGYVIYDRTKLLNIIELPRKNYGLFPLKKEVYDEKGKEIKEKSNPLRPCFEVFHIDENKCNHSIKNLCLLPYGKVTSRAKALSCTSYYYKNLYTGEISKNFSGIMELDNDIYLKNMFGNKYNILEISNEVYKSITTGSKVFNELVIYSFSDDAKVIEKDYRRHKLVIYHINADGRDFYTLSQSKAGIYLANLKGIEDSSGQRYIRNLFTKELDGNTFAYKLNKDGTRKKDSRGNYIKFRIIITLRFNPTDDELMKFVPDEVKYIDTKLK